MKPYEFKDPEWGTDRPAVVNTNEKYLDPLVYRTFPGTNIIGALPRRINPDYREYPSCIKRFFNWLFRVEEPPRYCSNKNCKKDIQYKRQYILITPDSNVHHYCSIRCLTDIWGHDCEWESTPEEVREAIEYLKNR